MKTRLLLVFCLILATARAAFPLAEATITSLQEQMQSGKLTSAALTAAYLDLVEKLFPLIAEKGLSAAVYTQTTDVEIEVNGLMTYDREQVKMDLKKVAAVNRNHSK